MSDITLEVQSREETGKNANRRLRATGLIPAVVYGGDLDPVAIQVDRSTLHDLFKQTGGENAVFLLKMAGTDQKRHYHGSGVDHRSDHPTGGPYRFLCGCS